MELIPSAILAFTLLLPFLNAWINRVTWTPKQKSLVALGTSILLAVVYVIFTGGIGNLQQLFVAIPAIYGASQAIFQFLVKNIATKFEALTTNNSTVIAPADNGTVTVASDETIEAKTDSTPVQTPLQVVATDAEETVITQDPSVKG